MSSGTSGSDEKISGSKVDPLASETKQGVQLDMSSRGAVGTDGAIDQARIDPIGGAGQYKHPAPHENDGGAVGTDETIQASKIDPLTGAKGEATTKDTGLSDGSVDAARIDPLGEVREEMS